MHLTNFVFFFLNYFIFIATRDYGMCNIFSLIFIKILKINVYILFDILILRDRKNIALNIHRVDDRYILIAWLSFFFSLFLSSISIEEALSVSNIEY